MGGQEACQDIATDAKPKTREWPNLLVAQGGGLLWHQAKRGFTKSSTLRHEMNSSTSYRLRSTVADSHVETQRNRHVIGTSAYEQRHTLAAGFPVIFHVTRFGGDGRPCYSARSGKSGLSVSSCLKGHLDKQTDQTRIFGNLQHLATATQCLRPPLHHVSRLTPQGTKPQLCPSPGK